MAEKEDSVLFLVSAALVAVDDICPRRRGDERRIPASERNMDRAATLVHELQARGFSVIAKKELDRFTLIERAAGEVSRACADLDTQGTPGAAAALDGLDITLRVVP